MNNKELKDDNMTLNVLSAVDENSKVTQRSISNELGIALGLTNSYFKKCIDKGLVKILQIPTNRYAYYLTPRGFVEKTRLTAEYFKTSFSFYRRAKNDLSNIINECYEDKKFNIVLSDQSELSEIATIISLTSKINLVGIIGHNSTNNSVPTIENIKEFTGYDIVLITDTKDYQSRYDALCKLIPRDKIIIPDVLKFKMKEKS